MSCALSKCVIILLATVQYHSFIYIIVADLVVSLSHVCLLRSRARRKLKQKMAKRFVGIFARAGVASAVIVHTHTTRIYIVPEMDQRPVLYLLQHRYAAIK